MQTPTFLKLFPAVAVLCLGACQCGPPEPALQVVINLEPSLAASCVILEVSAGGAVRLSQELPRASGKNAYRVGLKKGQLPTDVQLIARSFSARTGTGCAEPRALTSVSASVDAKFPRSDVTTATLQLDAPGISIDGDRDGHVAVSKGGDDCNDAEALVHPGLPASCGSTVDNDCDGKVGCADSECGAAAICTRPPAQLSFVTTAAPVVVNACSPALTVEVRDSAGVAVLATVGIDVGLGAAPPGGVTLFSDPGCLTSVTQVSIPTGQSRASFYFRAATAGSFDATATIVNLTPASQTQTVFQPTVSQLVFTNAALTVSAGGCSGALTLQTRDATGVAAPVPSASSIALSSNQSGVTFYADASCATVLTGSAVLVAAGATGGTFYARATSVLATTLTATLGSLTPATQVLTVTIGAPTQLAFATAAQGTQSGSCSSVVTVETRDAVGNPSPATAMDAVTVTTSGVAVALFSDATCTTAMAGALPLAVGAGAVSFYFQGAVAGMATLTATSMGLGSAMQTQVIGVGPPSKLAFTSAPQTTIAGACSPALTVQVQDANSNPSNAMAALSVAVTSGSLSFFTDASCATAVGAGLPIPAGGNTATFYYRGIVVGPHPITAASAPLTQAMQTQSVNFAPAMALVFTSAVQSVPAGTCAKFDLAARDAFGNPAIPSMPATVTLASTPSITFSSAMDCSVPVTSVTLTFVTTSFFATSTAAGNKTLTATAPFGAASQAFTVAPGPATQLGFVVQPAAAAAGSALTPAVQLAVQDMFGNTVTSATDAVTLAIANNPVTGVLSGTQTVAAVSGVAGFGTLSIDKAGTGYTLGATAAGRTAATSTAFDITPGAAARLVFAVQPTTATAGVSIAPPVQVRVEDALGNLVSTSTANITLALGANPGSGTLAGTLTGAAVNGVATFFDLSINRSATGYTLAASSGALMAATSSTFDITTGPAARVAFTVQPSNAAAGAVLSPGVQVTVQDALGNRVTTSSANITVAIGTNANGGTLSGTLTVAAAAGIATFSTLSLNRSGVGYTLDAASGGLSGATSNPFTIVAGTAAQLAFFTQPTDTTAGLTIDPRPRVEVLDALGNRVLTSSASITLAIANNPSAGVLSGTASVSAVNGVAGFPMMSINKSGAAYTLGATSTGLTAATSAAFTINPGAAAGLAFSVQPTSATSTVAITPAIQVAVIDALANRVTTSTANITLAIANNPPGTGILSGTATAAAASGVATFTGLSIDKAGTGYTLAASSIGLTGATSAAFTITTGLAARLAILGTPVTVAALDCSPVRTVQLQDLGGNPVNATGNLVLNAYLSAPGSASTAFFSNAGCTTASAAGNRTITSGSNQVSFHFLAQNATATLTLVTSAGSLISGTQDATITAAIPKDLAFTTAAPSIEAGFCQALTLERQDLLGRPTSPTSVTLVALGVTPTTGMLFFTDSTCTTPLAATFNIGAGASSTVLYAKGVSGSISATVIPGVQVYDLTASSTGLGDGVLGVTVAPMVRRRSAACTLAGATITCPITPTLTDISRTMLFFQATPSSSDDTSSDDNVTCLLELNAGAARVACERVGNAQNVDIEWQTVSFAYPYTSGGVTVQHVTGGCTAAASTPIDTNLSTTAPTTESFVLFSSRSTGTINDGQDFYTSQLTTSTTLRVSQSENTGVCAATMGFAAQVVSWAGATVNRLVSPGGPAASFPVSQATVPGSPTFLLYTSRMTGDIGFNDNICRRRLRGIISNASTLTFDRGCVGADIQDISWEHVRLPAGATVQPLGGAIASGSTTNAVTVPTAVDLTRSFSFIGGLGQGGSASGRTDYVTDDRVGSALARARLTSTTQLTFSRTSNSGNGLWQGYVVQLTP